jgi:MOSC domain-containing protein YiiM
MASLVSVQVSQAQTRSVVNFDTRNPEWTSAIWKSAINRPVWVGELGLTGDDQADKKNHGGPDQAVMGYSAEHYGYWRTDLPHIAWEYGGFGENLTIAGQDENSVCYGDIYQIGAVLLQVTTPRFPCWKLARRWEQKDLTARVETNGYSGWYYRVLEQGEIQAGQDIVLTERTYPDLSISQLRPVLQNPEDFPDVVMRLLADPIPLVRWADRLRSKLAQ